MSSSEEWWDWYTAYLSSPQWAEFRGKALLYHGRRCARCRRKEHQLGVGEWLEVDHLTYERAGEELLDDVQILCNACHRKKTSQDRLRRKVKRWLRV